MFGFNGRLNTCAVKVPPTDNRRTDGEAGTHCKSLGAQNCVTWPTHSRQGNFKFSMSCPTQDTFPRGELWLKLPLNGRPGASAAPAGHAVFPGQRHSPRACGGMCLCHLLNLALIQHSTHSGRAIALDSLALAFHLRLDRLPLVLLGIREHAFANSASRLCGEKSKT